MENCLNKKIPYDYNVYELSRGRKPVLNFFEERFIVCRMKEVADHGFAVEKDTLKSIAAKIADDGREGFSNGLPTDAWVRSFRALHRDITFRKTENKKAAKIAAEHPDHVESFVNALKHCERENPGILDDPDCIWSMDETDVTIGENITEKGFVAAETDHGGFKIAADDQGKHLTALIIASASGHVLPLLFIYAGTNTMKRWFEPLPDEIFKDDAGAPHWPSVSGWFPKTSFTAGTDHGSMTKNIIHFVIENTKTHTAKYVKGKKMILTVDGHKSRNGYKCLRGAKANNIAVVQNPANTSHFLQACDQTINSQFKDTIKRTYVQLTKKAFLNIGDLEIKFKLGVAGYRALTQSVVKKAFDMVRMWPMDFRFFQWAKEKWNGITQAAEEEARRSQRRLEQDEWKKILAGIQCSRPLSLKLNVVKEIVRSGTDRVHEILEAKTPTHTITLKNGAQQMDHTTIARGMPAVYLTYGGLIDQRENEVKRAILEKQDEQKRKEESALKKKEKQEEDERKKRERAALAEQRKRDREERAAQKKREKSSGSCKNAGERASCSRQESCSHCQERSSGH